MAKSLPTNPGSIITFRSDFETPGDPMLYCAALLVEGIDIDGRQLNPVWSTGDYSPYEENGYGFSESFSESFLLEQDFTVLVETELLDPRVEIDHEELMELDYGSVVRWSDAEGNITYSIFTPLYMDPDSGEVAEALWTNSDGYVANFNQAESIFLVCRAKSSLI